jgi:hypothetical protein
MCQVLKRSDIFPLILIINILSIVKDNIFFMLLANLQPKIINVVSVFSINAIQGKIKYQKIK